MKTVRTTLIALMTLVLLTSCATSKDYSLTKTIWYSTSNPALDDKLDVMVTSLHFVSANQVEIYTSVLGKEGYKVTPFLYATGNWNASGNAKKESDVNINTHTIDGQTLVYKGKYYKDKGMLLATEAAQVKPFVKVKNAKLPEESITNK